MQNFKLVAKKYDFHQFIGWAQKGGKNRLCLNLWTEQSNRLSLLYLELKDDFEISRTLLSIEVSADQVEEFERNLFSVFPCARWSRKIPHRELLEKAQSGSDKALIPKKKIQFKELTDPTSPWKLKRSVCDYPAFSSPLNKPFRWVCEVDGEFITRNELDLNPLWWRVAKGCGPFEQRFSYHRPPESATTAEMDLWCRSLEQLHGATIPAKARAMRMIALELERMIQHWAWLARVFSVQGGEYWQDLADESFQQLNHFTRQWMPGQELCALFVPGGVSCDLDVRWAKDLDRIMGQQKQKIAHFHSRVTGSALWSSALGMGSVTRQRALAYALTGPNLRACGANYDLRKAFPYYDYSEVDFDIPLGRKGDCFDRYLVRIEEIGQSMRLIRQLQEGAPPGQTCLNENLLGPSAEWDQLPQQKIYVASESADGEHSLFIHHLQQKGEEVTRPQLVRERDPCYFNLQGWANWCVGYDLQQARLFLEALNVEQMVEERCS